MNHYIEMKHRQQKEVEAFPMAFAFGQKQFEEAMRKLGLDPAETDRVCSLFGAGDIFRKEDVPAYLEMSSRHRDELRQAIVADKTGDGFIFEMFDRELEDHEFSYTGDVTDTLSALGISPQELNANPALRHGLEKACKSQIIQP